MCERVGFFVIYDVLEEFVVVFVLFFDVWFFDEVSDHGEVDVMVDYCVVMCELVFLGVFLVFCE